MEVNIGRAGDGEHFTRDHRDVTIRLDLPRASQLPYELLCTGPEGDLVAASKVSPRRRQRAAGTVVVGG
jgi:hypothetical protein